jgi:hypothetical protein
MGFGCGGNEERDGGWEEEGGRGETADEREREGGGGAEVWRLLGPAHLADRVAVHSQADSKKKLSQKKN